MQIHGLIPYTNIWENFSAIPEGQIAYPCKYSTHESLLRWHTKYKNLNYFKQANTLSRKIVTVQL